MAHPVDGSLPDKGRIEFWDVFADTYTAEQQGDMPSQIVGWLTDTGIIGARRDVLEIGSGPGTYSIPMSHSSKRVSCLDSSGRMLDRLFASAEDLKIENLERIDADLNAFATERRWDVVVSSLCSGLGGLDSLDRMDSLSKGHCVMISWIVNDGDSLQSEIWSKLGRDVSYNERSTDDIVEKLESSGRKAEICEFSDVVKIEIPLEEAIRRSTGTFSVFGLEREARDVTRKILEPRAIDGIYRFEAVNRIRVSVWESLDR